MNGRESGVLTRPCDREGGGANDAPGMLKRCESMLILAEDVGMLIAVRKAEVVLTCEPSGGASEAGA